MILCSFHRQAASSANTRFPGFTINRRRLLELCWFHEVAKQCGSATKALGMLQCAAFIRGAQGYQLHVLLPLLLFVHRPKEVTSRTQQEKNSYI